ncbi:MAG: heat-inducible transcription repressor HrcA [Lachnospiraceae bacterium]|nr:heat-inducible transcription repressor HrcA [Lachnospiraceae bacterium]
MDTVLDDRKQKILYAVVKNYLETGEPVGSRTISKFTDLNLSSATIRNEMADLEEMGYILSPHTSAGRIPSDKGYRFYVDSLMQDKVREVDSIKEVLIERTDRVETLLQQVAKTLATNTNYTSIISAPQYRSRKLKFLQLTPVDEEKLLAVILLEGNIAKNKFITLSEPLDSEAILKLNLVLNTFLNGLNTDEINLGLIQKMKSQSEGYTEVVSDILDAIADAIAEEDSVRVYTSGATNILKYPELNDTRTAGELLGAREEKEGLTELMKQGSEDEETGIQVYIGEEAPVEALKDCSVVTATYKLDEGVYGKFGIIGPKRMDYERVVGTLKNLMGQLDDIFKTKK